MRPSTQKTITRQPAKIGRSGERIARLRRGLQRLTCTAMLGLAAIRCAGADAISLSETQVKALFLFNFTKYVEWPDDAFASPTAPLTIVVLGDAGLGEPLRALVAGKTCNGHPIAVEDKPTAGSATNCHILFISATRQKDLASLLLPLRGRPVLVVGEDNAFTRLGGIVNFGRRDKKMRLEINTATAVDARLKLSSKLLGVADVVQYKP